jgi:chromosome segregation protein
MLALDEFEEQNKRYQFLSDQVEDLTTAKEDLRSTIGRINATAKKLFTETLQAVRTNFQQVFRELFEGGEADVKLEEDADPLEANIIITARPRGKKILSIHQLSGGERALTSISLLFSLYLVKPSPFCVLDEVDAPLDDANIGRFLKMIKRFSESTQFIIITHNKLTMEAADVLYGVTMSQPGVSQIVSVNLSSAKDRNTILGEIVAGDPEPEEAVEAKS